MSIDIIDIIAIIDIVDIVNIVYIDHTNSYQDVTGLWKVLH